MKLALLIIASVLLLQTQSRRTLPQYEINLDLPLEQRYAQLAIDFKDPLIEVYNYLIEHKFGGLLGPLIGPLSNGRGPEEPELQAEIDYIAGVTGLDPKGVQVVQWFYEFSSIMVPDHIIEGDIIGYAELFGKEVAEYLGIEEIKIELESKE